MAVFIRQLFPFSPYNSGLEPVANRTDRMMTNHGHLIFIFYSNKNYLLSIPGYYRPSGWDCPKVLVFPSPN